MKTRKFYSIALLLFFGATAPGAAAANFTGPVELRVDDLKTPLGIDDPAPRFSWQLQDLARGARQTTYQVQVASQAALLQQNKPDVWDSGLVASDRSLNVAYAGPALKPSTRYFWRVQVWDATGKPYTPSEPGSWETGLLTQQAWSAKWIGYETPEEATMRHAPAAWIACPHAKTLAAEKLADQDYAWRTTVTLAQPVRFAALYAAGQDTVSAWIDGTQVLAANLLPPWKQMPWKKFVRADVTALLNSGANSIAIQSVHYVVNPNGMAPEGPPPMIATLVVEYADGSWANFSSNPGWKVADHPDAGWQQKSFDDSQWENAIAFSPLPGSTAAPLGHPWTPDSVKSLRQTFTIKTPIKSARIYATALGEYELFLNGKRVGDQLFAPGWTDYRQHVKYQTYDVTALLGRGPNAIAALLAPGWYATPLEWFQQPNNYGDTPPALRAQMRIEHTDGSVEWVNTDPQWQAHTSYILHSELYDGETQDAREALPGWNTAQFSAKGWEHVAAIEPAPVNIEAQNFPPIRMESTLTPKAITQPKPDVWVFDFGQNFSGSEKLRVEGPAGTKVRLRFAEVLNPDGTIYTDNMRTALVTDQFILHGAAGSHVMEEFTPHFTFHGFRYVEVTGLPKAPGKDTLTAMVIHTDAPFTAKLDTGSPLINQLWRNILWGQRSNLVGLPTDCPQRDERLGWMADAQVFWRAATYNADLAAFSRKFAGDMRGTQVGTPYYGIYSPGTVKPNAGWGAAWSDAGVIIPYTSWLQSGDTSIIDENWAAMRTYLDAIEAANPDNLWRNQSGIPFGDWLSPEGKTNFTLIATAYWAWDVTLMQRMAHATGRSVDERKFAQLFEEIRSAFQKQFVRDDGFIAGADNTPSPFGAINNPNAKSHGGDTQTGYVLALHMNLLPDNLRAAAANKLAAKIEANHGMLSTGFLGTPYLLEELTKAGHADLAFKLLLNTQYPSWGYMVDHGATTMWERWNGDQMRDDPSMNSYNHYAYGAVADWIYRYAAGVDATPSDAGFHTVVLHPVFDARLGHVAFDYASAYGPIHSDWTVTGHTAEWHVTIPANTTGWLPLSTGQAATYKVDGASIIESKLVTSASRDGLNGFELAPGSYTFEVGLQQPN